MLNKLVLSTVLLFINVSLPSYAYVIGANLTVENETDVPMEIIVQQPNGQNYPVKNIPPHQTTTIYTENGDQTGLLYHTLVAPFSIKDAAQKTEYVNGRVAYYVGTAYWSKYSFLDSVAAGEGISVAQTYSCENGGTGIIFENKIRLSGAPRDPAPANPGPDHVRCEGVKESEVNNDQYFLKCSDDRQVKFAKLFPNDECRSGSYSWSPPSDGCYWWTSNPGKKLAVEPHVLRSHGLKFALDDAVGGQYCQTFEKPL